MFGIMESCYHMGCVLQHLTLLVFNVLLRVIADLYFTERAV